VGGSSWQDTGGAIWEIRITEAPSHVLLGKTVPLQSADIANVFDMFVDTFLQHQLPKHLGSVVVFHHKAGFECKHIHRASSQPQMASSVTLREFTRVLCGSPCICRLTGARMSSSSYTAGHSHPFIRRERWFFLLEDPKFCQLKGFFLGGGAMLGFELRASLLLSRCSYCLSSFFVKDFSR
jgi:hypothetical protein